MKIYNSLTKQIEDISPINQGKIGLYSCGPTVYDNLHIGNLAAFIYADLLRRTLAQEYDVTSVMNITDVDDKTIRDSKRDHPDVDPMTALNALTHKYEAIFLEDIARIGNDTSAVTFIRATDTIAEMINLAQQLLDKNIAYIAEDGVYFSIKKYEEAGFKYGVLQTIDRSHEHARIANDEYDKDHVSDFALWKRAESGEPSWEATFTTNGTSTSIPGRPGWHIECSAMSQKLLSVPFDIHTGGIDLKFPHHENEIAQSRGASGAASFANYFVHNNHVLIEGKKMSKSLNNFYTLRDIEDKGFDPLAFRMLVLSSHYRSESSFSWDILQAAQNRLAAWRAIADLHWQLPESNEVPDVMKYLNHDLDTPQALSAIDAGFDSCAKASSAPSKQFLDLIEDSLGIALNSTDISDDQKRLLADRLRARQNKDWEMSDKLRDSLKEQGIGINDTSTGQLWYRLTN
jgi:cysteinyl-tRNA synthetase